MSSPNRRAATLLGLYLGLVYLTLPLLPPAVDWFKASFGASTLAAAGPLAAALAAAGLVRRAVRRSGWAAAARLVPVLAGALAVLYYLRGNPVEQVHLLEYGLVGWLAQAAWAGGGNPGRVRLGLWSAGGAAAGLLDEVIQALLPNRFFDWRDVQANAVSVALGVAAALVARGPSPAPQEKGATHFPQPSA